MADNEKARRAQEEADWRREWEVKPNALPVPDHYPEAATVQTPNELIDNSFTLCKNVLYSFKVTQRGKSIRPYQSAPSYATDQLAFCFDDRDHQYAFAAALCVEPDRKFLKAVARRIVEEELSRLDDSDGQYFKFCWPEDLVNYYLYTGDGSLLSRYRTRLRNLFERIYARFDPDHDNLVAFEKKHWVFELGEPPCYADCRIPFASVPLWVNLRMLYYLKWLSFHAEKANLPDSAFWRMKYDAVARAIERFWSESDQSYYLEHNADLGKWLFSHQGENERSRPIDGPAFAVAYGLADERKSHSVCRSLRRLVRELSIFPLPMTYPFDGFSDSLWFVDKSWQPGYKRGVLAVARYGDPDDAAAMVRKMSAQIIFGGDKEPREWYYLAGGSPARSAHYPLARGPYTATAGAHLSAIVEGLFGLRPTEPGFRTVQLAPCFPLEWKQAKIALPLSDTGALSISYRHEPGRLRVEITGGRGSRGDFRFRIPAHARPHEVRHNGKPIPNPRTEKNEDARFVCFSAPLSGSLEVTYR